MNKQTLTDGSGRWFDLDKAKLFQQRLDPSVDYFAAQQWIGFLGPLGRLIFPPRGTYDSPAAENEELYRMSSSEWILHKWVGLSIIHKWTEISEIEAAKWLKSNGYGWNLVRILGVVAILLFLYFVIFGGG